MLTHCGRNPANHQPNGTDHPYCYDGYPQGAASTVQGVVPITRLQQVPNQQVAATSVPHWIDPTREQGMGRDSTFANGWMARTYVKDYTLPVHTGGRWPTTPRVQQGKQHRPGTGPVLIAARVNSGMMVQRGGTLPAPVTVMRTVAGNEPL